MDLLMLLFVLSPMISVGNALKCHVCQAPNVTICTKGNPHLREVNCGLDDTTFFWFCLYKVIYDKPHQSYWHKYSCERMGRPAIFKNLPQCKTLPDQDLVDCRVCLTDLCVFPSDSSLNKSNFFVTFIACILSVKIHFQVLL